MVMRIIILFMFFFWVTNENDHVFHYGNENEVFCVYYSDENNIFSVLR